MRSLLHYELHKASGRRPWIVFLHGAGGSIATWNRQIPAFKETFNLLLIDLRDHGASKNLQPAHDRYNFDIVSDDILAVLDHENIAKAHFVTLSFGSVMMQALYRRRPEVVQKMIFIGGVFNANWSIKGFVHLARFLNLFLSYRQMYRLFSYLLIPKKEHQLARRIYQQQARTLGANEYLKWLGLYSEFFMLLKSFHRQPIENPMLILMGEDDYLFLASAMKFDADKSQSKLTLIPGAGHICNIDQPQRTNEGIFNFLDAPKPQEERQPTKALSGTS